jgi:hypothetical protein
MEAARTSETSIDNYFTWQYIPQDKSELHTRRRENLKSHIFSKLHSIWAATHIALHVKCPLSMCDFNQNWNVLINFSKTQKYQI